MKKLLLISLILPFMVGQAQVALLDSVTFYSSIIDSTYLYRTVKYDSEANVTSYNIHDQTTGEVELKYHFENDTVKQRINITFGDTGYFQHIGDTIWFSMQNYNGWYRVNQDYQIVESKENNSLVWELDNLIQVWEGGDILTSSYLFSDYYNPYFNVWKTFKGQYTASQNQIEHKYDLNPKYYEVKDALHNYPTEIDEYAIGKRSTVYTGTYYYYYTFILDVPEIPEYSKVLSVSYYNLLGQQIEKPKRGFYIERKVTDNGVISTKHYLK
jgi:hypothetical protein